MRVKTILAAVVMVAALAASAARADPTRTSCTLTVNGSPSYAFVPIGQTFTYEIDITYSGPSSGPLPSPPYATDLFTIVFYGSKNGVADIPPSGETYPGSFGYGHSVLTGYWNPGGFSGLYQRQAVVYSRTLGFFTCATNVVVVSLQ